MADTLLRVFDSLDVAEQAREALIASGIAASAISINIHEDEAGPVEGNFVVDLTGKPTPSFDNPNRQSAAGETRTPIQRSTCLLQVEVDNDRDGSRAAGILNRFAGRDHAERMDSRQGPV
jgi:hypothetical protein